MEKVRTTNPTDSTEDTLDNNSNNITDDELERLRVSMSKKPSPVEGVDNIVSYNVPKTTLETIRLLVASAEQCKDNLRTARENLRTVVASIGPDINLIEDLEDELKEAVTGLLTDQTVQEKPANTVTQLEYVKPTEQEKPANTVTQLEDVKPTAQEKPANTVTQQGGKKKYYIKYV